MSVAKEFTTDRNTDVKTAGNRVIEGCNSLLVAYTRDSFDGSAQRDGSA